MRIYPQDGRQGALPKPANSRNGRNGRNGRRGVWAARGQEASWGGGTGWCRCRLSPPGWLRRWAGPAKTREGRQGLVGQKLVGQELVGQKLVGQKLVGQELVGQELVGGGRGRQ